MKFLLTTPFAGVDPSLCRRLSPNGAVRCFLAEELGYCRHCSQVVPILDLFTDEDIDGKPEYSASVCARCGHETV